ncbi:MAG: 30S ribosomal protein S12 methylthiotransferase RimO [Clostridia bacterium]|nr:30S ribosomal protein S12 methylthiotransferase RimO [Clostridia bacterium]
MAKIGFISLGCDKNTVDSEKILELVMSKGHTVVTDENEADILIINTCAFIKDAKEESINTIIEMGNYKKEGNCKYIICCGCLGERYKDDMFDELPEVDAILGVHAYERINEVIDRLYNGEKNIKAIEKEAIDTVKKRVITTPGHYEYLKIAEGCNNFCTYCAIPLIRGKYKSRPMEDIIEEAKFLASEGVTELLIVAQEVSCYGIDLYGEVKLSELVSKICEIDGIHWVRLLYCYPENVTDDIINVIKNEEKVCKYIDIPIQHTQSNILKLMGRRTNHDEIINKIKKLKKEIPEIIIRSTLIVGFPGETDEDFNGLCEDVKDLKIDRLGVFDYSKEDGTPAEKFENQIDDEIKIERKNIVMDIQEKIAEKKSNDYVGKIFEVIVDGYLSEDNVYCGRTYMDMPDVDGIVFFESDRELMAGDYVKVEINKSLGYDLCGKEVE